MQKLIIASLAGLACLVLACRKEPAARNPEVGLILSAERYFQDSIEGVPQQMVTDRAKLQKSLQWDRARATRLGTMPAVLVPVKYQKDYLVQTGISGNRQFHMNDHVSTLFYQKKGRWVTEMLTYIPDTTWFSSGGVHPFTGTLMISEWNGKVKNGYRYIPDAAPLQLDTARRTNNVIPSAITVTCQYIIGYNYSPGDPDGGYAWSELISCSYAWGPESVMGTEGGSGYANLDAGGNGTPAASPVKDQTRQLVAYSPRNLITDVAKYFGCFGETPGASYNVTVCVNQPDPGSRNPWTWSLGSGSSSSASSPVNVGHTFLIFTESIPGQTTISRNVGFYPSENVFPYSAPVTGVLNDNGSDMYNIGGSFQVTAGNFMAMIQAVMQPRNYQVNTNNCTNFALDVLDQGHVYLPRTIGGWVGGVGLNPGDLGEDIRGTNFAGMERIGWSPHGNTGSCN